MRYRLSIFFLIPIFSLVGYAGNSIADEEEKRDDGAFLINNIATYKDGMQISDSAKSECGLERSIPIAIEQFSQKFKVKASMQDTAKAVTPSSKIVSVEIENLVAGRGGSGFGGRWVVSEIGVTVSLKMGADEAVNKYFSCSAGLGANPFANFKACDRLERCSEQIGAKAAKWLSLSTH